MHMGKEPKVAGEKEYSTQEAPLGFDCTEGPNRPSDALNPNLLECCLQLAGWLGAI
jgi:hypothetical protein